MPNLKRLVNNGDYFYFKDAPIHISGVSLDKHSITLTTAGQTEQLTATVSPAGAVDDTSVTWSSSDTSVATVSSSGLVTCVTPGDCTITVTTNYGGFTDTCEVAHFIPIDQYFGYTGAVQCITLQPATYCLEVWGAEGGCGYGTTESGYYSGTFQYFNGGKGGFSYGKLTLDTPTTLYVYVGGKGENGKNQNGILTGGFNGGGDSGYNTTFSGYGAAGGSGGGGTDIRINYDSIYARVIVAGGGGGAGAGRTSGACGLGGYGGGFQGCDGTDGVSGGTSCRGGAGYTSLGGSGGYGKKGSGGVGTFGVGGSGYTGSGSGAGGGGGGGWYGGGAGGQGNNAGSSGGGGGSGYVYNSTHASDYPSGGCLNSNYYLIDANSLCGCQSFPSPSGSTETGHTGCGCVRIRSI